MPGEEKTLADIVLRWITDTKSQKVAVKSIQDVEKAAVGAGKTARALGHEWQIYIDTLGKSEKEVRAVADALDGTGPAAQRASETLSEWNQQLLRMEGTTEAAAKSTQKLNGLLTGVGGFTLIRLGRELDRAGRSILSPIQAFVEAQGETTQAGIAWLDATRRIEESTQRIGAVMAQQLLPTLEKAAELTEKVAALIEANPGLAKAAAFTGIGAIGLGGLVTTIGDLITTIAGLKVLGLLPKGGIAGALGGGAGLAGASGLAVGGAGVGAGIAGFAGSFSLANYLRENFGDPLADFFTALAPLAGPAGPLISSAANLEKLIDGIERLGRASGLITETKGVSDTIDRPSKAAVDAYIDFVKANADAEDKYMKDRQSIIEQGLQKIRDLEASYASQRAIAIQNYEQQRSNAIENFNLQQTFAEAQFELSQQRALEDYYNRRTQLAQDYRQDVQRAEEAHQRRITADHARTQRPGC